LTNLAGEVQEIRMMAPGKRTLFLNGRIANRLGSSIDSAIRERQREVNMCGSVWFSLSSTQLWRGNYGSI